MSLLLLFGGAGVATPGSDATDGVYWGDTYFYLTYFGHYYFDGEVADDDDEDAPTVWSYHSRRRGRTLIPLS